MKKILSLFNKIIKNNLFYNIINFMRIIISCIFYLCLLVSIIIALENIFYIQVYPFAAKELFLSFEIIVLMIMLYWAKLRNVSMSVYRILWILAIIKIFFMTMMLSNIQKVTAFEDCADFDYCKSFTRADINQTNCLKDNGAWNVDENACDYRYNSHGNCEKRIGNWIYPDICNGE